MTRVIGVFSGKGGVGKTTLTSNLAYALTELGHDVTVIDGNLTTPHLGMHLGLHLADKTLHHVLKGKAKLRDATYRHPYGFKVIPGSLAVDDLTGVNIENMSKVVLNLLDKTDFVLIDAAPSLGREAVSVLEHADEVLFVANPDLPSVADTLKTLNVAERLNKKVLGIVLNRVTKKGHELKRREIERIVEKNILAEIPEDENVAMAIASKVPVIDFNQHAPASVEIRRLAHQMVGKQFRYQKPFKLGFLGRIFGWYR